VEEAFEAARRSQASVYAVGLLGWSADEGMGTNKGLLTQITEYTGGRAFFPAGDREMREAFDRISDELHRQYRMAYLPSDVPTENGWHGVEVRLTRRSDLVVRTRLGYHRPQDTVR
jgi:VWFA-related protein